MDKVKATVTAVASALMSWLGILAVPVFLLVGCNVIDYATGICAAKYRSEAINSDKGMRGIIKKVCMWLLVLIGSMVDMLVNYAIQTAGVNLTVPFVVATVVAVWLVVNEMISILENIRDIGIEIPPFLMPIMERIKQKTEHKAKIESEGPKNE